MKTISASIIAALLLSSAPYANAAGRKMAASFLPGLSIPVNGLYASNKSASGDYDDGMKPSLATAAAVDAQLSDSLALGMEIGRDWSHAMKQEGGGYSDDKISLWQFTPYVRYSLKPVGKITPYGILGLGLYSFHQNAMYLNGSEFYAPRTLNYLGFNAGIGATYELCEAWSLGLDLRWHHVFGNIEMADESTGQNNYISLNNFTPSMRVQYAFSI